MAKKGIKLDMPDIAAEPAPESKGQAKKKSAPQKKNEKKRRSPAKFFRDIISELKKVSWASFKKNKDNGGVLSQTGVVLLVTLFFMIIIAAFDAGLGQLLKLLLNAAAA